MGAVADAALAPGGKVVGVVPADLVSQEIAHRGLSELRVVNPMHRFEAYVPAAPEVGRDGGRAAVQGRLSADAPLRASIYPCTSTDFTLTNS